MKSNVKILAILLVTLTAFAVIGCNQKDTRTAKECMDAFAAAVNAQKLGDIHDCLISDAPSTFNADFWETYFGSGTGNGTFSATFSDDMIATASWGGYKYTFVFEEDDTDYYAISSIHQDQKEIFPTVQ